MNVVEKINLILKKANISKVNLSKYLGVSRQMIYNYLDGDNLSKMPNEKCQLLFDLLDVNSTEEILNIKIDNEYLEKVGSKIFNPKKNESPKNETINLTGLKKEDINIISDIVIMLKNIILEGKGREGESEATIEYIYNFIQNLGTNKELKYLLGYFSKNFARPAKRGSISLLHRHGSTFKSAPHPGQRPWQSSLQRFFVSRLKRNTSAISSSSSN